VDNEDFDRVKNINWSLSKGYAYGAEKPRLMHRYILNPPEDMEVDHVNGDTLDNRRNNIRVCTSNDNKRNRRTKANRKHSPYKGVYFRSGNNKWEAYIGVDKKKVYLGSFDSDTSAAMAYNRGAKKFHGDFAKLNIINT